MTRLLTILFLILSVIANAQPLKTLSIQQQLEDIAYIKSELQKLHPGIYAYQSKKDFETGFELLKNSLEKEQTVFQFYDQLVPVVNQIGCGHTIVKIPPKELKRFQRNRKFLPLEINIIDDIFFVKKVLTEGEAIVTGTEILSINGVALHEYLSSNLSRYPSDGRIMSRKYQLMEKNFSIDFSMFYSSTEDYVLEVQGKKGIKNVKLPGISYHDYRSKTNQAKTDDLELQIIDSISTAVITIRNSSSKKDFSTFLEDAFSQIHDNLINNLIIDIRYDSFNRDRDGAELYSYLTNEPFEYYSKLEATENYDVPKVIRWFTHYPIEQDSTGKYSWRIHPQLEKQLPKRTPFSGSVFVLTDGFTFSATAEFSSIIKSNKRGLIIGVETGGGYYGNNSGGMLRRHLPNSNLKVIIPPLKYIMAVEDLGNYASGVIPDISVSENVKDMVSGIDRTLDTALKLIQNE